MALRNIRLFGDDILKKKAKPVKNITPRMKQLAADMLETMYDDGGVGLAAPQVGILRRMFVVDVDYEHPYVFINPEILEQDGEQTADEGCLSLPGKAAEVTRPNHIKVKATGLDGKEFTLEADELLARAILHENDHLDGILYTDRASGPVHDVVPPKPEEEE